MKGWCATVTPFAVSVRRQVPTMLPLDPIIGRKMPLFPGTMRASCSTASAAYASTFAPAEAFFALLRCGRSVFASSSDMPFVSGMNRITNMNDRKANSA